ncbi:hypothetical protein C6502_17695 [Candidatus Poribacteria bacterium]|nr:MAG: hypothetical protein C6502_17695 [Candidatus Poribacteria bacterium]
MSNADVALTAHLMRRAGFGTTLTELDEYVKKGYENVVEDLVDIERCPPVDEDILDRYFGGSEGGYRNTWMFRMINSPRPLEEKMALFWHHVFATGVGKNQHILASALQIDMLRRVGLSNMREILLELSKDPAMIFWLDNNENRKGEPNENYGRELLELFSMGVGNYSEDDIKDCSRAFTGWTFTQPPPLYPQGYYPAHFVFIEDEHDNGEKTFLGHTGNLNGDDIIDIIVQQPACAKFISRHLYNFFVADEPQVPSWNVTPPQDPEAIDTLSNAFLESGGDIRHVLRTLFNSDFFKEARFKKVKSPTELVTGILKLVGTHQQPELGMAKYPGATALMGQELLNPPTVEGWHTGREWIDGGTLTERINFSVGELSDPSKPGIEQIISRLKSNGSALSPDEFVDRCLEMVGPLDVGETTRESLTRFAASQGDLNIGADDAEEENNARVVRMLQLIVSSREYQFA